MFVLCRNWGFPETGQCLIKESFSNLQLKILVIYTALVDTSHQLLKLSLVNAYEEMSQFSIIKYVY